MAKVTRDPVIRSLLIDEMIPLICSSVVSIDDAINELHHRRTSKAKNLLEIIRNYSSNSLYYKVLPYGEFKRLDRSDKAFLTRNKIGNLVELFNLDFTQFNNSKESQHIQPIRNLKNSILTKLFFPKNTLSIKKLSITLKKNKPINQAQRQYLISENLNSKLCELDEPIFFDELSVRTTNCLKKAKIKKYNELKEISEKDIMNWPEFGRKSLKELTQHLEKINQLLEDKKELPKKEFIFSNIKESVEHDTIFTESLSVRTSNSLKIAGIEKYSQLKKMSAFDLLILPNFGSKSLNELKSHLSDVNQGLLLDKPLSLDELMQKKRERFFKQTRNGKQIIEMWNNTPETTLNSIGKSLDPPISRERVRQLLKKAKGLGITLLSKLEKSKRIKDHSLSLISNQYQSEFINLYNKGYANLEIMRSIGISIGELQALKKYLLNNDFIQHRLARTNKMVKNPGIEKRRQMILTLINNNMPNKEIALTLGISIPTLLNDKNEMRKSGMSIPPAKTKGRRVDSDEINYRTYFIEDKISKGWSKAKISKALGFKDGGFVSRHIKKYML